MDEAIRIEFLPGFARTLTPTPAQRPGPRWRRGRSKTRAP
ncbi:SufE family protein, partial [Xanthomonas oryzae pv. oryzae]